MWCLHLSRWQNYKERTSFKAQRRKAGLLFTCCFHTAHTYDKAIHHSTSSIYNHTKSFSGKTQ
jgi:hypothetical protein